MVQAKEPVVEPEELGSAVWSKTPSDVVNLIIEQSDRATLHIWSRTCSAFHRVASALLWGNISIHGKDLQTYWEWTHIKPPSFQVKPENGGIVDFLIRGPAHEDFYKPSASRHEDLTASPRSRIRRLSLDTQSGVPTPQRNTTSQDLEIILGFFATFMNRLDSLTFDGPLYQGSLWQMVKFENLKHLVIRRGKWFGRMSGKADYTNAPGRRVPPPSAKLALDFTCLSDMHSLSNLYIAQLRTVEARGLAQAVRHLQQLTHLSLSASSFIIGTRDTGWHTESPGGVSPFIPFLEALFSRGDEAEIRPGDDTPGGFPRRLQILVLDDPYHHHFPSLTRMLQRAIEPCHNLAQLIIEFQDHTIAQKFLFSLGSPKQLDGKMASRETLCSVARLFASTRFWKRACQCYFGDPHDRTVEVTRISGFDSDEMVRDRVADLSLWH